MTVPAKPKIYHITHVENLASIISDGCIWSDARTLQNQGVVKIGMSEIKRRRLKDIRLSSHTELHVGECVPFYFCPRSIMLYLISKHNHPELQYKGGQEPIVHLEADLKKVVNWAEQNNKRWAFTLSNAGAYYFEDRKSLENLNELDWNAINSTSWHECREKKQAEFLIEEKFPWNLVDRIGIYSKDYYNSVVRSFNGSSHHPVVEIKKDWYY
jgi:hypothetical protein